MFLIFTSFKQKLSASIFAYEFIKLDFDLRSIIRDSLCYIIISPYLATLRNTSSIVVIETP